MSLFPFILPSSSQPHGSLTLWDAAASRLTLTVMIWSVAVFLPAILAYTLWSYHKMWGRVMVADAHEHFSAY